MGALLRGASRAEAARIFAKVLGQIEVQGVARVAAAAQGALTTGTPVLLAPSPMAPTQRVVAVPPALRDLDVPKSSYADNITGYERSQPRSERSPTLSGSGDINATKSLPTKTGCGRGTSVEYSVGSCSAR